MHERPHPEASSPACGCRKTGSRRSPGAPESVLLLYPYATKMSPHKCRFRLHGLSCCCRLRSGPSERGTDRDAWGHSFSLLLLSLLLMQAGQDDQAGDPHVLVQQLVRELEQTHHLCIQAKQRIPPNGRDETGLSGLIGRELLRLTTQSAAYVTQHPRAFALIAPELLRLGDQFRAINEYKAAAVCFYGRILGHYQPQGEKRHDALSVQATFGLALCRFQTAKGLCTSRSDAFVRLPGTLERLLDALALLCTGLETAVQLEVSEPHGFAWLVLNGTVLLYSMARPLQLLGFEAEVVHALKLSLLTLESTVSLCTTRYIKWRVQLYAAVCDCYEAMALKGGNAKHWTKAATACAEQALKTVLRLRKEEELDLPLPSDVAQTLGQVQTTADMLVARARWNATHEPLTKKLLQSSFADAADQIRVAVDWMARRTKADSTSVGLLGAASDETIAAVQEPLAIIIDTITPLLITAPSQGSETGRQVDASHFDVRLDAVFPLPFHFMLLKELYRLKRPTELTLLVQTGLKRVAADGISASVRSKAEAELALFKALVTLDSATTDVSEGQQQFSVVVIRSADGNRTIPIPVVPLLAVAAALTDCVCVDDGSMAQSRGDLLVAVAVKLWQEFARPMVDEIDATETGRASNQLVSVARDLLLTLHRTFTMVDYDDVLLLATVGFRLTQLLRMQQCYRLAGSVVRVVLDKINDRRDQIVRIASHCDTMTAPLSLALSCGSFTFNLDMELSKSDCATTGNSNARDSVGVQGTGSQFGAVHQDLACLQVDLTLLLYQVELEEAACVDALARPVEDPIDAIPPLLATLEAKLVSQSKKNGYAKLLLNLQRMKLPSKAKKEQEALVAECLQCLHRLEAQERELQRCLMASDANEKTGGGIPVAPVVVSRSSTSMTVRIRSFEPPRVASKRRAVAYYMVYAKPVGAGTAVSVTNNDLPGTGEPIFTSERLLATVDDLVPNESYVFAVAAFDQNNEIIQEIGETSAPVVALNPLPAMLCYGYLAQTCQDLNLFDRARQVAAELYAMVVSRQIPPRAGWKASPFYRNALQYNVVARIPVPILNSIIRAIFILCHEEAGDPKRDGRLSSLELKSVTGDQVVVLEMTRKICIGIELACITGNYEAIRLLCFKGYRVLLPILHLDSVRGMTFPALATLYEALLRIPYSDWDVDTQSIFARVGFELFRIALECRELAQAVMAMLSKVHHEDKPAESKKSNELRGLEEALALHQLKSAQQIHGQPAAAAKNAPHAAAPAKSTPQSTPRGAADSDTAVPLPSLEELIGHGSLSVPDILAQLQSRGSVHVQTVEFICKLAAAALQRDETELAEQCIASTKLPGRVSEQFRFTLTALGGACYLPDPVVAAPASAPSAPVTARSAKTPRQDDARKPKEDQPTNVSPEIDASGSGSSPREATSDQASDPGHDDDTLYVWCGELFFLQSLIMFRRLVQRNTEPHSVKTTGGPAEDCASELLNPASRVELDTNTEAQFSLLGDDQAQAEPDPSQTTETEIAASHDDQVKELFGQFLEKLSASCQLFRLGRAWQALQASCQYLWNALWVAWISPRAFGHSPIWMDQLSVCVDALLDMIELVSLATMDSNVSSMTAVGSNSLQTLRPSSAAVALASTTVITSVSAMLSTDLTWITNLVRYSLQCLCCCERWQRIVVVGKRFYFLRAGGVDSRFAFENLPILIYAQTQLLAADSRILDDAQAELSAFVKAFQEAESKKKKKKSRLVVDEIVTPEEAAFRQGKEAIEHRIEQFTQTRNRQQDELRALTQIHETVEKTMNKCTQALEASRRLVIKYRYALAAEPDNRSLIAQQTQIGAAYSRCVTLARQKRQRRSACTAFTEVGDFQLSCGHVKSALKSWNEGLDNTFSALNVVRCWRDVVSGDHSSANLDQIAADGLWVSLDSCSLLARLVLHASGSDCFQAVEYSLMGATIIKRLFACSLPHPSEAFLYGSYVLGGEFWPERELMTDSQSFAAFPFILSLVILPEVLLQYDYYASSAMPTIATYNYLASYCLHDVNHIGNARRLRVEALIQCGRIHEALYVLAQILHGNDDNPSRPNQLFSVLQYDDSKAPQDSANQSVLAWYCALDAEKLHGDLCAIYTRDLVGLMLVTLLRVAVCIARWDHGLGEVTPFRASTFTLASELEKRLDRELSGEERVSHGLEACRREFMVQQSNLVYFSSQWTSSKELCLQVTKELSQATAGTSTEEPNAVVFELDQELKYSVFTRKSTLTAKCRLQVIRCEFALAKYHDVLVQCDLALQEAQSSGEVHICQQIELIRCQALVLIGEREKAETALVQLIEDCQAHHTIVSTQYVQALQVLSSVLRAKAILKASTSTLEVARTRLIEAQTVLDELLERDGWIGVGSDDNSKRMNVYHPAVPHFVRLAFDLAEVLVECPLDLSKETMESRRNQALEIIESGLKAIDHTTKPMAPTKASLLLLKGAILRKLLVSLINGEKPQQITLHHSLTNESLCLESAESLSACIRESIADGGGHDRQLIRTALMELVDLYGLKSLPGREDEHTQAAFHYLNIALQVQAQDRILMDSLELQTGTISSMETLPSFLADAIHGQDASSLNHGGNSGSIATAAEKRPDNAPAGKKGSIASVGTSPSSDISRPGAAQVVNYFVHLVHEKQVLSVGTDVQQESALLLHSFLVKNHSSYAKSCCLSELPAVPTTDPEIPAGLVCAHWGQDITPALIGFPAEKAAAVDTQASRLTLYFTLGTTQIPRTDEQSGDAATIRMERFAVTPLLSKRSGWNFAALQSIKERLNGLRIQMEDEGSLIVDKASFERTFREIARSIQHVVGTSSRLASPTRVSDQSPSVEVDAEQTDALMDAFRNEIPLVCSLETVRSLESLFDLRKGLSTSNNILCYFVRDLLD